MGVDFPRWPVAENRTFHASASEQTF